LKKILIGMIIGLIVFTGCAKDEPTPHNKVTKIYTPRKGVVLTYAVINKSSEKLVKYTNNKNDYNPENEEIVVINDRGFDLSFSPTTDICEVFSKKIDPKCNSVFYTTDTGNIVSSVVADSVLVPVSILFLSPTIGHVVELNLNKFTSIINKNNLDIKRKQLLSEKKERFIRERIAQEKIAKEKREKLLKERIAKEKRERQIREEIAKKKEREKQIRIRKKLEKERLKIKKHNKICSKINRKINSSNGTQLIKLYNELEKEHCN